MPGVVQDIGHNGSCTVRLDSGELVNASAVKVARKGDRTLLSLRPERVKIDPASQGGGNIIDAAIEELIYLGDHVRTRLTVAGQSDFIVKIPNTTERPALKEGMKVKIGWAPEDCRALDDV
jgi:putative spermidine/putrescine transport system ATP-binding protein